MFRVYCFFTHYWFLNLSNLFKIPSFNGLPRKNNMNQEFFFPRKRVILSVNYWYLMALSFYNFDLSIFFLYLLTFNHWHLEFLIFKLCLFSNYFSSCCLPFMSWKLLNEIHISLNALISQKACFPDLYIHRSKCQSVISLCISKVTFPQVNELF